DKDEVSVIIVRRPCILLSKAARPKYQADHDKCKKCGMCMKIGCPAINKNADGTVTIDTVMCNGCDICAQMCKFGAISLCGGKK
ncbi:MAG: 4Fe-4S binding protein, partial [Clostridia bacterium]